MLLTTDTNNKLDHTASGSNCVLTLWCWHQRANNPTELAPIELLAHCWWQESPKGGSNKSCLGFEWPKTELTVMKWINLISKRSFGVRYVFGSVVSWGLLWDMWCFWIRDFAPLGPRDLNNNIQPELSARGVKWDIEKALKCSYSNDSV